MTPPPPPFPPPLPWQPAAYMSSVSTNAVTGTKEITRRRCTANIVSTAMMSKLTGIPTHGRCIGRGFLVSGGQGGIVERIVVVMVSVAVALGPTETCPHEAPLGRPEHVSVKVAFTPGCGVFETAKVVGLPAVTVPRTGAALSADGFTDVVTWITVFPPA